VAHVFYYGAPIILAGEILTKSAVTVVPVVSSTVHSLGFSCCGILNQISVPIARTRGCRTSVEKSFHTHPLV